MKHAITGGSILLVLLALTALPLFAQGPAQVIHQDEGRSVAPNVYLDCDPKTCDFSFIKTEITFVNYVLDRQSADVHVIVTRQTTGSGGREYTLSFLGLRRHKGKDDVLRYYSKPTDTEDQVRRGFVNVLKQGLIPYVYDTPLAEFISISYARREELRPAPPRDKWNYWVFSLGLRGNGNFEEQSKRYSYQINLSANRTTEASKFRMYATANYNHRRYEVPDDEPIISRSNRKSLSPSFVKSITGHWSWAVVGNLYSSTFDNARLYTSFGPGIEYNLFPYSQSTRRELRVQYQVGVVFRDYYEITLYEKEKETLFNQNLQIILEIKEPWGSVGVELSGSAFLHDLSKNRMKAEAGLWVNILKGLSFNVGGEYQRIRDQLSLPLAGATVEEILLELKRLASGYNLTFQVGFSYRFGSIYSNVVNPRFGNM